MATVDVITMWVANQLVFEKRPICRHVHFEDTCSFILNSWSNEMCLCEVVKLNLDLSAIGRSVDEVFSLCKASKENLLECRYERDIYMFICKK